MLLEKISGPADLTSLSETQLKALCQEIRQRIIEVVANKGGHLGASLGTVELTVALHRVFNSPNDAFIWDVGHQAYGHKILTGRNHDFETNRQWNGISGFPSRDENPHDAFGTGHAGTSISAALGMALAKGIQSNHPSHHIAIIGDASIASGMALEALNHLGTTQANVLVVLNDNAQSIDPSVGALKDYFGKIKTEASHSPNMFQALNLPYSGPIDGHDLSTLMDVFTKQASFRGPRLLHVVTTKGKGLTEAEKDQVRYHAPGKFDPVTGKITLDTAKNGIKYQQVVGDTLVTLAQKNPNLVAITPAMITGSGLSSFFQQFPNRSFDVGIAEQHALTLAAGMASAGLLPYCFIYSTFLQRAYDQLIHDIALQRLPVVICVDRAGLVGHDGPTHHGVFDIAFLRTLPHLTLIAPSDAQELRQALYTCQNRKLDGPVAIRYPRGTIDPMNWKTNFKALDWGKSQRLRQGSRYCLISVGPMKKSCSEAIDKLENPNEWSHLDLRFIKPLDTDLLFSLFEKHDQFVIVEDGVKKGGAASAIQEWAQSEGFYKPITAIGISDIFVPHGPLDHLYAAQQLDIPSLTVQLKAIVDKKPLR